MEGIHPWFGRGSLHAGRDQGSALRVSGLSGFGLTHDGEEVVQKYLRIQQEELEAVVIILDLHQNLYSGSRICKRGMWIDLPSYHLNIVSLGVLILPHLWVYSICVQRSNIILDAIATRIGLVFVSRVMR